MRELPISIQRAILRRNAVAMLSSVVFIVGLAGYLPWSSIVVTLGLVGVAFFMAGSKTAKRLNALEKNKRVTATFAKAIENLISNILIIALPLAAVSLVGLRWLIGFSGNTVDMVFYPSLIALALLTSLGFYVAQLPAVFPDHRAKVFPTKRA